MPSPPSISPNRLLAWYRKGAITRSQWLQGMRQQLAYTLFEIQENLADPKRALLETWRCKRSAQRLKRNHTEAELREVFMALSELDDFPPATYLWNADQLDIPLYCFLREKRAPVIRFRNVLIHRLSAKLTIEYGGPKSKDCTREALCFRRDWRGTLVMESRDPIH